MLEGKLKVFKRDKEDLRFYLYILIIVVMGVSYIAVTFIIKFKKVEKRFKPVIDIDQEIIKVNNKYDELRSNYKKGKLTFNNLRIEIDKLSDDLDMMANGLYEPKFDFDTSDQYKMKIKEIRARQKMMIRTCLLYTSPSPRD